MMMKILKILEILKVEGNVEGNDKDSGDDGGFGNEGAVGNDGADGVIGNDGYDEFVGKWKMKERMTVNISPEVIYVQTNIQSVLSQGNQAAIRDAQPTNHLHMSAVLQPEVTN